MVDRKTILITGGSRGIGRGLVEHFVGEHDVIFTVRKINEGLPEGAEAIVLDVKDDDSIRKAVKNINRDIDILINNAGVFLNGSDPALEVEIDDILKTFDINTLGAFRVSRAIVPMMKSGGRIINISSGLGQFSEMVEGGSLAYRMSKVALNVLTKVLSHELLPKGISVNSICPGWVKTDMGGADAIRSVDESVSAIVKFALSEPFPNGGFFRDGESIDW